jgi:hypothetical protein
MRKPTIGKQRSASAATTSLSKRLPRFSVPKSATPSPNRPHPKYGKPFEPREGRKK